MAESTAVSPSGLDTLPKTQPPMTPPKAHLVRVRVRARVRVRVRARARVRRT